MARCADPPTGGWAMRRVDDSVGPMDIECATATELVLMLATGDIASRELLDVQIAQMERHNPAINAVVALDLERACSQARAADEDRVHGGSRRPLHGLP